MANDNTTLNRKWTGVDLDGTLIKYKGWQGIDQFGDPVPKMVERVKAWKAMGKDVRVFTARICPQQKQTDIDLFLRTYTHWCFQVFGEQLPVTCTKDFWMEDLWDDRCVSVVPNTGIPLHEHVASEYQDRVQALSDMVQSLVIGIAGSAAAEELKGLAKEAEILLKEEKIKWKT